MTPTAALIFMWIITRGIKAYTTSYRQECKDLQVDRLFGQVGPRTMRPRFVVVVIGAAPRPPLSPRLRHPPAPPHSPQISSSIWGE